MSWRANSGLALRGLVVIGASIATAQEIELASPARHQLEAAGGFSGDRAVSPDGRFVAFTSPAANLAPGQIDLNFTLDVFLYFVVVGQDGIEEGSYGKCTGGIERPEAIGIGACDAPRALGGVCP